MSATDLAAGHISRMRELQQEWRTHATTLEQLRAADELGRLLGVEDESATDVAARMAGIRRELEQRNLEYPLSAREAWGLLGTAESLLNRLTALEAAVWALVDALKNNYDRGASYDDETGWLMHYGLFYDDLPTEKWLDDRHRAVLLASRALVQEGE